MITKRIKILSLIIGLFFSSLLWAQEKHPRVAELEDKIQKEASDFLNTRFPKLPFSVSIDIDPIRRQSTNYLEERGETLPYYALDQEEILDEWDDPAVSLYALRNRVKTIAITAKIPSAVSDTELAEIKDSLINNLRLLPARDKVEIVREKWTMFPQLNNIIVLSLSILCLFLVGLLLIIKFSMRGLNKSLSELKPSNSKASAPQGFDMPNTAISNLNELEKESSRDLKFNDPIKTKEIANTIIDEIVNSDSYLNLDNFMYLEELCTNNVSSLGAILALFPLEIQKQWLSYSKDLRWLDAFDHPGEVSYKSLDALERMCRVRSERVNKDWDILLIQIWRLGHLADDFLKKLPNDESFAILVALPKALAVPIARRVYPGSWASIIDDSYKPIRIDDIKTLELISKTLEIKPKINYSDLKAYQREKELLNYIALADTVEEREIYEASPSTALIKTQRPPFYKIFEANPDELSFLYTMFGINEWSLALFDVPRDWRENIEQHLNDK